MKGQTLESVFSHNEKSLAAVSQTAMHVGAYEPPRTMRTVVETEGNFCGSVIDENNPETQTGMTISEHGFADPNANPDDYGNHWEIDASNQEWDK